MVHYEAIKRLMVRIVNKNKTVVILFVVLAFVSLFNLYLNDSNQSMVDQFDTSMTDYYDINRLLVLTRDNAAYIERYLRELDADDRQQYEETKQEIKYTIDDMYNRFSSKEVYFILNAIKNSTESYFVLWDSSINDRDNQVEVYYESYYEGEKIENYTEGYIEELLYLSLGEGTILYNQLNSQAETMGRISLAMIIGVFFWRWSSEEFLETLSSDPSRDWQMHLWRSLPVIWMYRMLRSKPMMKLEC